MTGLKFIDKLEEYLVAFFLAIMAIINFGNVISRYFLKASWSFTGEILIILFVWVVMLAAAIGYKRSEHLGLPLILDLVPAVLKKSLIVFSGLMSIILMVALGISGYNMVSQQIEFNQTTSVLLLPEWFAGISVPIGSLLVIIRVIQSTLNQLASLREGEEE